MWKYLAVMVSCVCQLFKNVAERGHWSEMVMEAHTMYRESNTDGALLLYTLLAELGYEVAQSNVAYILDKSMPADQLLTCCLALVKVQFYLHDAILA